MDRKKKFGVGVVGLGWVSGEHLKAFRQNPHCEVVAVCARDIARAKAVAHDIGPKCRPYSSYERMLADDRVDIVSICTFHPLHPEQTILAAKAGKHIAIEKPVALDLKDLKAMRDAVRKAKVKTVVSFVLRWNPLFDVIKGLLAQNALGDLYYAEVDYLHGIGRKYKQYDWNRRKEFGRSSLLTAGCHAVDGLRWFVQDEAVEVSAYANTSAGNPLDYEYPPNTVTIIKFKSGLIGKVASMVEYVGPYLFPITIMGNAGTIRNNQVFSTKLFPGQTHYATVPTILPDSGDVSHHPFIGEINHLVDSILHGRECHVNLDDAVKTHEICLAADKSAETGKPVKLPLLKD